MKKSSFFSEMWFRLKLYFLGIRFYEVTECKKHLSIYETTYRLEDLDIHFSFQRVPCSDLVLKRGRLRTDNYNSYTITATFDQRELLSSEYQMVFKHLSMLKDKAFFFNGHHNKLGLEETKKLELITDIYIDFISEVFRQKK